MFKGGEEAKFTEAGRDVSSCRYGCTLTENFFIEITPEQLKKYAEAGVVPLQIRAGSAHTAMINIPVAYIAAVNEVAK